MRSPFMTISFILSKAGGASLQALIISEIVESIIDIVRLFIIILRDRNHVDHFARRAAFLYLYRDLEI